MDDPKVIEALVKSLDSQLGKVGTELAIATASVVGGLLIEYWDDAKLAFEALYRCARYKTWLHWIELERHVKTAVIGGVFITFGVAAELWCEHRTNDLEGQLQRANGSLMAILNGEAAALNERATLAEGHAKELDNSTQQLKTDEAIARKDAETEKLERDKLEALVSPRRLSLDEQKQIEKSCAGMNHTLVRVESYGMDAEGRALASQIAYAIFDRSFGVNIVGGGLITSGALDEGVLLKGPPNTVRYLNCLAGALTDIGNLKNVSVNGARHEPGMSFSGGVVVSGGVQMSGSSSQIIPAGPLAEGSSIDIFVGVKPIDKLELKKTK